MGTPSYMPPEQAGGKKRGPVSRRLRLGAIFYCLLTGRPPFQAASPMDTLMQVLERDPVPPRQLNSGVPRDLDTITLKSPGKTAGQARMNRLGHWADIRRWLHGEPIAARPVGRTEKLAKWATSPRDRGSGRGGDGDRVCRSVGNRLAMAAGGTELLRLGEEPQDRGKELCGRRRTSAKSPKPTTRKPRPMQDR